MSVEIPHGTRTGYVHHRCRCPECRKAENSYRRRRRAENPEPNRVSTRKWREKNLHHARKVELKRKWVARHGEWGGQLFNLVTPAFRMQVTKELRQARKRALAVLAGDG